jgi:hypothetical protein
VPEKSFAKTQSRLQPLGPLLPSRATFMANTTWYGKQIRGGRAKFAEQSAANFLEPWMREAFSISAPALRERRKRGSEGDGSPQVGHRDTVLEGMSEIQAYARVPLRLVLFFSPRRPRVRPLLLPQKGRGLYHMHRHETTIERIFREVTGHKMPLSVKRILLRKRKGKTKST